MDERVNHSIHGTTNEIPNERLPKEILRPIDTIPEYHITRNETHKISGDCYVSYLGNRYSVPYVHAGRTAKLCIDDRSFRVYVQGKFICEHEIQNGHHRTIRLKEHFSALLAKIRSEPTPAPANWGGVLRFSGPEVERRDLSLYEVEKNE